MYIYICMYIYIFIYIYIYIPTVSAFYINFILLKNQGDIFFKSVIS